MFWCKDTARSETLVITEVFWRDSQFNWIQISVLDFVFMLNDIHRYRFTLKLWNLWSALSLVLGTYPVWRGRSRRGCVNSADNLEPPFRGCFRETFFGSHSKTVLDEYSEQRLPSAAQWLTTPLDASLWKKQVAFHPPSLFPIYLQRSRKKYKCVDEVVVGQHSACATLVGSELTLLCAGRQCGTRVLSEGAALSSAFSQHS